MSWHSLNVLKSDMAEISQMEADIEDQYIIQGSRPPPPRRDLGVDEEEFRQRYWQHGNYLSDGAAVRPDLDGIKEFIKLLQPEENLGCGQSKPPVFRIVISKETPSSHLNPRPTEKSPNPHESCHDNDSPVNTTVTTKLNPNLPSFYPSYFKDPNTFEPTVSLSPPNNNDNNNTFEIIGDKVPTNPRNETSSSKSSSTDLGDKKVDTETVESLKKKIVEASKNNRKWEKNVAMAALLKLKTSPRMSSPTLAVAENSPMKTVCETTETVLQDTEEACKGSSHKNLVLCTPEYFEKVTTTTLDYITPVTAETAIVKLELTDGPNEIMEQKTKESVQKVENWLKAEPAKPKSRTLFLKPAMFKRKSAAPPPAVCQCTETKQVKPAPVPSYVPSEYAAQLARQYEDNAKARRQGQAPDSCLELSWRPSSRPGMRRSDTRELTLRTVPKLFHAT